MNPFDRALDTMPTDFREALRASDNDMARLLLNLAENREFRNAFRDEVTRRVEAQDFAVK